MCDLGADRGGTAKAGEAQSEESRQKAKYLQRAIHEAANETRETIRSGKSNITKTCDKACTSEAPPRFVLCF